MIALWLLIFTPSWSYALEDYAEVTLQNGVAIASNGTAITVNRYTSIALQVTITNTATVTFEGSTDGTTYASQTCTASDNTSGTLVTSTTTTGMYQCNIAGLSLFRARVSSFTSGTVTVFGRASTALYSRKSGGGGGAADGVGYDEVDDEGVALTKRAKLNMTGAGVTCTDNSGAARTDCVVSAPTHTLLDGLTHTDTTAGVPGNGDLIISDTNMWAKLSGPTSASERCFVSTGTGAAANVPTWSACSGVNAQTGPSYTVLLTDNRKVVTYTNASPVAVTLPQATTAGFAAGWHSYHRNVGATVVTITPTTSTIGGLTTLVLDPGEGAWIVSDGTNYQAVRGGSTSSINAQTGVSYTISRDDADNLVTTSNAGAIATTLPQATTAGFGKGFSTFVKNIGVGTNTITPTTSTINGAASLALTTNQWAAIFSDGTNYIALKGSDSGGGGAGTVTNTGGSLTANAVVLGAGTDDTKVVAGITTDGTSILNLGVAGASTGKVVLSNTTSGTITITPPAGALGSVTTTIPATTGTLALNSPSYLTTSAESTLSGENVLTAGYRVSVTTAGGVTTLDTTTSKSKVVLEDEFCGGVNSNGNFGNLGWSTSLGTFGSGTLAAGHPCVGQFSSGATINNIGRMWLGYNTQATGVLSDVEYVGYLVKPSSALTGASESFRLGLLANMTTSNEGADGVYFSYLPGSSANWRSITKSGGSTTANSSTVAVVNGTWVLLEIVRSGSDFAFYINGTLFQTHTTNIPAGSTTIYDGINVENNDGTARTLDLDWAAFRSIALTSRHP